jgi:hypothetical protein
MYYRFLDAGVIPPGGGYRVLGTENGLEQEEEKDERRRCLEENAGSPVVSLFPSGYHHAAIRSDRTCLIL